MVTQTYIINNVVTYYEEKTENGTQNNLLK